MKKIILVIFVLLTFVVSAQSVEQNIKKDFTEYYNLISNVEIEASMDYVIVDFFEIFPKDELVAMFEEMYTNPEYDFKFEMDKTTDFSKVIKVEGAYYSVFTNNSALKMRFNNIEFEETEEEKFTRNKLIEMDLKETFGPENVSFDRETNFFTIYPKTRVCAKSDNGITDWKFLNLEENQLDILKKIIPKKVFKLM